MKNMSLSDETVIVAALSLTVGYLIGRIMETRVTAVLADLATALSKLAAIPVPPTLPVPPPPDPPRGVEAPADPTTVEPPLFPDACPPCKAIPIGPEPKEAVPPAPALSPVFVEAEPPFAVKREVPKEEFPPAPPFPAVPNVPPPAPPAPPPTIVTSK